MSYTLSVIAERNGVEVESLKPVWEYLIALGWVSIVGIDESGEWLYEPTPRLMGKVGRN